MPKVPPCPVDGCKLTVDTKLKSSDGMLFGAHQRNLEMHTEGFPTSVSVEETADVLRLILRYTHHIRQPSLDNVPFTLLVSLAEAVEKYKIYAAMEVCKIKMTNAMLAYPNETFFHFAKHNYPALADMAAKATLNNSASDFLPLIQGGGLHDDIAFRWIRYRDRRIEVLVQLVLPEPTFQSTLHKGGSESCPAWPPFQFSVIKDVGEDLSVLDYFSVIVNNHEDKLDSCHHCRLRSARWASLVSDKMQKLPEYSEA